ncbi:antitoxin [Streptomonospora litoralis]|uniref:MT0933-like antitoxin protein n=1 Tax=Streptomonospora litoralis TaxID=2498135 RepID=A0A4P6Q857_9ACTN|nr:antitoxin [Streptomonospora litoralis]QBI55359.1 hypothetical protein EKD16_17975 [Streptomonospora litoralis]
MSEGSAFDKIKKAASGHKDKVEQGAEKVKDFAKEKTGGKYDEKIDQAGDSATDYITGEGGDSGQSGESGSGESGESRQR